MTESDFGPELIRLYRGFAHENDLTPERMAAAFARWGFLPTQVMRNAVDRALTESKLPSGDWFDRLIQDEHDRFLDAQREERNVEAGAFFERPREVTRPDVAPEWVDGHSLAIKALLSGERGEAKRILGEIGSSANLQTTVPLDGGVYLRQSGMELGLWPPNFLDAASLKHIGWPWPEWPRSLATLQYLNSRRGRSPLRPITIPNEPDFEPTTPPEPGT